MAVSCISCGVIKKEKFSVYRDRGKFRVVAVNDLTYHQAERVAAYLNLPLRKDVWNIEQEA